MTLRVCERAGGLELRAAPSSSLSDIRTHPHTHKQDNGTKPYKYSLDSTNPTPIRLRLPALVCPYPFGFGGNAPVLKMKYLCFRCTIETTGSDEEPFPYFNPLFDDSGKM
jgi:hypothetical protein